MLLDGHQGGHPLAVRDDCRRGGLRAPGQGPRGRGPHRPVPGYSAPHRGRGRQPNRGRRRDAPRRDHHRRHHDRGPGQTGGQRHPDPIETADPAQDKIDAAKKLMSTGRHADLLAAKKLLVADVGSGNGTVGEAKLLKQVCTKLADRACVAKASSYIK